MKHEIKEKIFFIIQFRTSGNYTQPEFFRIYFTSITMLCKSRYICLLYFSKMHSRLFFFFSLLFLQFSFNCCAQDAQPWEGFGIDANAFEGKVIKHTPKFELPIPALTTGLDINFQYKSYGKKAWEQRRRYPVLGVGITYTNYGNDSIYGRCFSIYPNLLIPLVTWRKLEWTIRIGDGIGYVTRDYSRGPHFDTINNAIGSKINDYASFMTDLRYHLNHHWDVQVGANFSHISDASFHQPNLGINLVGAHVGFKYFPVTSTPKHIVRDLKPLKNRWLVEYRLSLAYNESNAPQGPLYPIYVATAFVSKRWISKNKFFAGFDYSYNSNVYAYLRNNLGFVTPGTEAQHSYKTAFLAGNEFLLGRVGVVLQVGYYLHQALQVEGLYYEKIGGNLYLVQKEKGPVKEFFLCAFLKTHLFVAEFADFGFGMGF